MVLLNPIVAEGADRAPKISDEAYSALIAKAESGAADIDYLELRKHTSARLLYAENNWEEWGKADELVDSEPEKSLSMARERMRGVWTDFLPHIVAQLAWKKLGKPDQEAREREIVGRIVRSISGGNKGTSADDAFNAVSVAEEYRTLALLRWKKKNQSLVHLNGHSFDVFKVVDEKDNQERQVWFNIDVFFGKELGL